VKRWMWLSVDVFMKMVIDDYMCCDYFGIELWHYVYEDFGSYAVMIYFFTNADWLDIVYSSRFWILCLWCDMTLT
jgi:hypothetical protein